MQVTIPALARRYSTSERTVRRWRQKGVDISDPVAVAKYATADPKQSLECLTAIAEAVENQKPEIES